MLQNVLLNTINHDPLETNSQQIFTTFFLQKYLKLSFGTYYYLVTEIRVGGYKIMFNPKQHFWPHPPDFSTKSPTKRFYTDVKESQVGIGYTHATTDDIYWPILLLVSNNVLHPMVPITVIPSITALTHFRRFLSMNWETKLVGGQLYAYAIVRMPHSRPRLSLG